MSAKNKALVASIVKELIQKNGWCIKVSSRLAEDERWVLFDKEDPWLDYAANFKCLVEGPNISIFEASEEKARDLTPETLGRIISTGVNDGSTAPRVKMNQVYHLGDGFCTGNGRSALTFLAAIVLTAAVWDMLRSNVKEMTAEEVENLQKAWDEYDREEAERLAKESGM